MTTFSGTRGASDKVFRAPGPQPGSGSTGVVVQVQASDVRWDKVNRLRAAIASGTYCVSSTAVAEKLMESMLLCR